MGGRAGGAGGMVFKIPSHRKPEPYPDPSREAGRRLSGCRRPNSSRSNLKEFHDKYL